MRVDYHPAVEAELREISGYYDEKVSGLGREFLDAFEAQIERLVAAPDRWMIVAGEIRRCLMRRFPYIIYFRQLETGGIRITAVKHQRRHPGYGRFRE